MHSLLLVLAPQVVIAIDPAQQADVSFWKEHNPEAFSMVDTDRIGGRCAVACCLLIVQRHA